MCEPKPEWQKDYHHVGVPISSLTVEAIGGTAKDKGKNIFALGLIAKMFDLNVPKLEKLIGERFTGKDPSILNNALAAFHAGYSHSLGNVLETFKFVDSQKKAGQQVVMNGNEALAYGLIAAGVRFGAGYPITPWSDIMELLRRELPKYGGTFVQCEDEIAAISMAIGASYAGRVAVTGSSGPGISLKTEALGWAVMAEMPLVIVDVQRGGPSTGMPTNVEQSDLNIACFGGHGDSPRVVLAPANVEDCFYTAIEAVNIARKYSVPVIILTRPGHRHAHRGVCRAESRKSLPGHLARFHAGRRPQALRFVRRRRRHAARRARHAHLERQISHRHRPRTRRTRPSDRLAEVAHADDRQAPQEIAGARRDAADAASLRPARRQRAARRLGFDPGPDQGSRGPRPRRRRQRFLAFTSSTSTRCRPGLENIFSGFNHILVVEMNDEGLYGYGQLGRPAARPLLRPEDSRHQQDRRPDLEGARKSSNAPKPTSPPACANCNLNHYQRNLTMSQSID